MTRIWIISDLHIDQAFPYALPDHPDHDLIVIAGDISDGAYDPVPYLLSTFSDEERSRLVYVPGNHDAYRIGLDAVADRLERMRGETGITTLDRQVVEIGGRRVVGATMWTPLDPTLDGAGGDLAAIPDFAGDDWRHAHYRDREWLEQTVQAGDIVATHHAPGRDGLDMRMQQNPRLFGLSSGYFADMSQLIADRQPAAWIHGHTHVSRTYEIEGVPVASNALGRGIGHHFDPSFVIEIEVCAPELKL